MRNRALLFGLLLSRSLMLGGCSQQPEGAGSCQDSCPAPTGAAPLSLEELDRAFVRDQGVYAPEFGDGEMAGQSYGRDSFDGSLFDPQANALRALLKSLQAQPGSDDAVFYRTLYFAYEVSFIYQVATEGGQPAFRRQAESYTEVEIWVCEPDEPTPAPTFDPNHFGPVPSVGRPYTDRWVVEPDGRGGLRPVLAPRL